MAIEFRSTTGVTEQNIIDALNTNVNITAYTTDDVPDLVTADAATYVLRLISAASSPLTVTAPSGGDSFTLGSGGIHFQDPDNFPASVSRIEFETRILVPSGLATGTYRLWTQGSDDIRVNLNVEASDWNVRVARVEDTDGVGLSLGGSPEDIGLEGLSFATSVYLGLLINLDGNIIRAYTGGSSDNSGTETGTRTIPTNTGAFQSGSLRKINFCREQAGGTPLPQGIVFEWLRVRFYDGTWGAWRGVGDDITSNPPTGIDATAALASPWYVTGNAT